MHSKESPSGRSIHPSGLSEAEHDQSGPGKTATRNDLLRMKPGGVMASIVPCRNLRDALGELHTLLEQYSPTWYTQRHYERAESALRLVRGL